MIDVLKYIKGSPLENPFVPQKKPILGSLIGALGGMVSQESANAANIRLGEMNQQNVRETNATNKAIADAANAYNYKMFQEQNAFNLDMWNKQNAYNDPSAQVSRMLAAGINPAAQFGNVSEAGSLSSADAKGAVTAEMQAPINNAQVGAFDPTAGFAGAESAVLQALNWKTNAEKTASEVNYNNVKAQIEAIHGVAKLSQMMQEYKKGSIEYEMAKNALDIQKRTMDYQVTQMANTTKLGEKALDETDLRIASMRVQNDILSINKDWLPKMNGASYASIQAGIRQAISAANMNNASAVESAARTAVEKAREAGMKIDNENARDMQEAIVLGAYYEADKKIHEAGNERKRYYGGEVGYRFPLSGYTDKERYNNNVRYPDFSHYYKSHRNH